MNISKDSKTESVADTNLARIEIIEGRFYVKKAGGLKEFNGINGMKLTQGTYRWQIADSVDGAYEDIEGETGNQYTILPRDLKRFYMEIR